MKKLLFVVSSPPYSHKRGTELLDAALVAGAFDCDVSVLFRDDGVWSLEAHEQGNASGQRSFAKMLTGLADYDVDRLYACRESMVERGIHPNPKLAITVANHGDQQRLIAAQDAVIGAAP